MSEETRREVNLGKVCLTDAEIEELKQNIMGQLGGVRLGYDEEGKPGYYTTDEAGADTVIPFSSRGAGGRLYFSTLTLVAYAIYGTYIYAYKTSIRLPTVQYKKITMSGGNLLARATNSTIANQAIIEISGYQEGQATSTTLFKQQTGQTKSLNPGLSASLEEVEINIEDYSEVLINFYVSAQSGVGYATLNNLTLE